MRNLLTAVVTTAAAFCTAVVLAVLPTAPAHAVGKCWTFRQGPEMLYTVPYYTWANITDPGCWIKWILKDKT